MIFSVEWLYFTIALFGYFTLMWALRPTFKNHGLVDLAWSSSLVMIGVFYLIQGQGTLPKRLLICVPYIICGSRLMTGWILRTITYGADPRWDLWVERWQNRPNKPNLHWKFFLFYQYQWFTSSYIFSYPVYLVANNTNSFSVLEYIGISLWATALFLENYADFQLEIFKRANKNNKQAICKTGLWRFCRHPNYFFEFCIWVSYFIMSIPSFRGVVDFFWSAAVPLVAYLFLVHYTGIPITERSSLRRRGEAYKEYQNKIPAFWPKLF